MSTKLIVFTYILVFCICGYFITELAIALLLFSTLWVSKLTASSLKIYYFHITQVSLVLLLISLKAALL